MRVSVKKKSNPEVEGYIDVEPSLPPLIKRTPVVEPTPKVAEVQRPKEVEVVAAPPKEEVKEARRAIPKRPSILNLGELLSGGNKKEQNEEQATSTVALPSIDPNSHDKLVAAKSVILNHIAQWRPRFMAVFEPMKFSGNTISIVVPTTELKEEILRNRTELLTKVVELSGVEGVVELVIEVNEAAKSLKPIKLEDRIAHIMGLNPLIAELKEALDLDVEG